MTQNAEDWISTETGDGRPLTARERIAERLRGRNPVQERRERVLIATASARAMREGIPNRVDQLMRMGMSHEAALKKAQDEADAYETQVMARANRMDEN